MKNLLIAAGVLVALGAVAEPAQAQVQFGVQANYADDFDFGIGARAQFALGPTLDPEGPLSELTGVVSFDYYFPDCGGLDCSYIEFNGNALYPIDIGEGFAPYVGGGIHVGRVSVDFESEFADDTSDTEVGLNALGGATFGLGVLSAFAEAKLQLAGAEQFALTFGVLFGGD
ncbi:MAG: hypothetical protein ACOCVZ_10255 [Gemmatimonadota bacterium]